MLKMPKSGNHVFLEAMQTLQSCQQTKGVLGGTLLYHNKVVVSQLSADITKKLILTDPHRIKTTGEVIHVDYHVPVGVQLLVVYVTAAEYRKLRESANRAQTLFSQNTAVLPFQIGAKKKLKRDKSILFSNIPEEEAVVSHTDGLTMAGGGIPPQPSRLNRPTHLPLRFKNLTAKDIPESGFSSINFNEGDSYPDFIGKTSVVSTPLAENKILSHTTDIMSICVNPIETGLLIGGELRKTAADDLVEMGTDTLEMLSDPDYCNYISNPFREENDKRRRRSLSDIISRGPNTVCLRPFGIGLQKLFGDDRDDDDLIDDVRPRMYRTITDPTCPIFNSDGKPISKNLFQYFLEKFTNESRAIAGVDDIFREFDRVEKLPSPKKGGISISFSSPFKKKNDTKVEKIGDHGDNGTIAFDDGTSSIPKEDISMVTLSSKPKNRKNLSLPIKSFNLDTVDSPADVTASTSKDCVDAATSNATSIFDEPAKRKKLSNLQLTPLMNKLTVLAMSDTEKSSGFSSWDTTPGVELPPGITPIDTKNFFKRRQSIKCEDIADDTIKDPLQRVELFVCGQQNMTMFMLLEDNPADRQTLVQNMWEVCVSRLTKLETSLYQVLNLNVESTEKSEGGYSFVNLDEKWDTVDRGGPWSPNDLLSLELMHKEFTRNPKFTEMLLRSNESVVYGYQGGMAEIFYQQPANSQNGLPPPTDPMGNVPLCAQRRLERDHSIILL